MSRRERHTSELQAPSINEGGIWKSVTWTWVLSSFGIRALDFLTAHPEVCCNYITDIRASTDHTVVLPCKNALPLAFPTCREQNLDCALINLLRHSEKFTCRARRTQTDKVDSDAMNVEWTPFRWPFLDRPTALSLLRGTAITTFDRQGAGVR